MTYKQPVNLEAASFRFNFRLTDDFGDGVPANVPEAELTEEQAILFASLTDFDQDSLSNLDDNCPAGVNGGQEDGDGDGIGDAYSQQPLPLPPHPISDRFVVGGARWPLGSPNTGIAALYARLGGVAS